jgi:hypothetical protein
MNNKYYIFSDEKKFIGSEFGESLINFFLIKKGTCKITSFIELLEVIKEYGTFKEDRYLEHCINNYSLNIDDITYECSLIENVFCNDLGWIYALIVKTN